MASSNVFKRAELFLSRDAQFCTICHAQRKGWIRVSNLADLVELRVGRNSASALKIYKARRRAAAARHIRVEHPEITLA